MKNKGLMIALGIVIVGGMGFAVYKIVKNRADKPKG
jgi:preprotein translocase subunit Sss1